LIIYVVLLNYIDLTATHILLTVMRLFILFLCINVSVYAQTIAPYLQAPTPTSIWICWKTESNTESTVLYGNSPAALTETISGTTKILSDNGYSANYYYHSVQLTGLTPNTAYYYKVKTGSRESAVARFRTLPAKGGALADGHLRFIIIGDNQLKNEPRWDTLVVQAKRKSEEKYGAPVSDYINMVINVGDQVDVGTLDHYEFVHLDKAKYLSNELAFNTLVGNHETYGTLKMRAYYDHFFYDEYSYNGISSGTENYYAFQAGRILFLMLSTEHTGNTQKNWAYSVIESAKNDTTVDMIVTECHRPLQAEQYVGDISTWVRDEIMPKLKETEKAVLVIGAHHHLYARGQVREVPMYHIISGGSAWDQYWGMAVEQDFDDVQKTISNWGYQIIDYNTITKDMVVETYSCGSIYKYKNNVLIDRFHRKLGQANPNKPALTNTFTAPINLPLKLISTAYSTTTNEPFNSTWFQVSSTPDFSQLKIDHIRDFENLFGAAGSPDSSKDIHLGINILEYNIGANALPNGQYYARVRHRDQNAQWSAWSDSVVFEVTGSINAAPSISTSKKVFAVAETIQVAYANGPGNATDWVGIYKKGQTPGGPASTTWKYVTAGNKSNGVLEFVLNTPGEYFIGFFANDGYTDICPRIEIFVGTTPSLNTDKAKYNVGETVVVSFSTAPATAGDRIAIFKVGQVPGATDAPKAILPVNGLSNGSLNFINLPKGYYFTAYLVGTDYFEIGSRVFFAVGDTIATISTDKSVYAVAEDIVVTFRDGPGIPKDYLGIFEKNANPETDYLYSYSYVDGKPAGVARFTQNGGNNKPPQQPGDYFVVFFTNDSYTEISNRVYFKVNNTTGINQAAEKDLNDMISVYPNPVTEYARIKCKYPIDKVELVDSEGKTVATLPDISQDNLLYLNAQLPAGTYILRVHSLKIFEVKMLLNK
jgi:hypothetical protein